ncbi:MAG TPA: DUF305 domain-containing protein [Longimicrobiales bacterium]|nr:DUF305 domain-containing protein [Longimicrobiales bacterium]
MRRSSRRLLAACLATASFSAAGQGAPVLRAEPARHPAPAVSAALPAPRGALDVEPPARRPGRGHAAALHSASAPDTGHARLVKADVDFLQGMIGHHAQAVLIAGWAPSHGASPALQSLCERIAVGQTDEIRLIANMLRDHGAAVPEVDTAAAMAMRPGMHPMPMTGMHHTLMPGMLTQQQLEELDAARGPAFDRLFLTDMIIHHRGALDMVDDLFGSPGAAQDAGLFQLASDISADQTVEIDRMSRMLAALEAKGDGR